jgi:hypothetical protein
VTIPYNITNGRKSFKIRMEHIDHNDIIELQKYPELRKYLVSVRKKQFVEAHPTATKVKIISVGIYDSEEGLASRPRDVDYNS